MTKTKFSLSAAFILAGVVALPLFAKTDSANVLKPVDQVVKALANDDLSATKSAAGDLSQAAKASGNDSIAKHAAELAKSETLGTAREHLKAMSTEAAKLAQGSEQYHVMNCPMANASWVQSGDKVMNPYMGKKMQQCGSPMKSKEGGATAGMACCAVG